MFNFKKNSKLYLVQNGLKYKLEVYPDFSASQTFSEQGYKRKTLHDQVAVHDHASITRANSANFSFTVPFFDQSTIQKEIELATTYTNGVVPFFDLYVESDNIIYKLEKSVFEGTTFNIARDAPLTVSLSGSASKILKVESIPGTLQTAPSREFTRVSTMEVTIGGTTMTAVANVNIEVENDITWIKNDTIHESLTGNIIYPQNFVLSGREVKGSLTQFLTSENQDDLQDQSITASLTISINTNLLAFSLPSVVFTRRTEFGELVARTYDYRLNTNNSVVKPIYKGV